LFCSLQLPPWAAAVASACTHTISIRISEVCQQNKYISHSLEPAIVMTNAGEKIAIIFLEQLRKKLGASTNIEILEEIWI
jgi:hypothetical protein